MTKGPSPTSSPQRGSPVPTTASPPSTPPQTNTNVEQKSSPSGSPSKIPSYADTCKELGEQLQNYCRFIRYACLKDKDQKPPEESDYAEYWKLLQAVKDKAEKKPDPILFPHHLLQCLSDMINAENQNPLWQNLVNSLGAPDILKLINANQKRNGLCAMIILLAKSLGKEMTVEKVKSQVPELRRPISTADVGFGWSPPSPRNI